MVGGILIGLALGGLILWLVIRKSIKILNQRNKK